MPRVMIALGSNVGDRLANLRAAVDHLSRDFDVRATSRVYETAPMYVTDQPPFYNAAVAVETTTGPNEVLTRLKAIEAAIGRANGVRNGPREIDLDLIAYGVARYRRWAGGRLVLEVPHPRAGERRFVLQPLSDVSADGELPGQGTISALLAQTEDQAPHVQVVADAVLPIPSPR